MKNLNRLIFVGGLILLTSCQSAQKSTGNFNLLPEPQQMEFTGASEIHVNQVHLFFSEDGSELPVLGPMLSGIKTAENMEEAQVVFGMDPDLDLGPEGYTLEIIGNQISITGKDRAGLLYGFMTLEQLMEDAGEQDVPLPLCLIEDYPLLSYRAIHLDMKHHLEKREYYYKLMDKLAHYKINAVIAEVEDKLGYTRRPAVASEDALSIEEWKKLSDYALERNVEISPLVQGLGHASFILKHEEFKELRDDRSSDWAFNPLDPGTYEVQFDLYLDAMEAMPHGRYLHVGGDEVHTTGRGSGKSELELQLTWLNRVCEFAGAHGRIPIFWDDMPLKYADLERPMFNVDLTREEVDSMWVENEHKLLESLDLFPENCIYMRWNYSAPQAEGNIKAMEWFTENGLQVMGATAGQTRWVLMPQNESNMENIRSFAVTSIEKGLNGLLLTLWDDDSPHFELYMRGILAFAEYSWSGDRRSRDEIKAAFRQREYSAALRGEEYAFVDLLEKMVGWWNPLLLKKKHRNALHRMGDPLKEGIIDLPLKSAKGTWSGKHAERIEAAQKVVRDCDEVAATITTMKSKAIRNRYRLEVYEQVNELVRFPAHALLVLQAYDEAGREQEEKEALAKVLALSDEFNSLRTEMEGVYGQTRILTKPEGYLLDQDHHQHLANQSISFDWQFKAELLFLEKIEREFQPR
jgi:hexosaminidase